MKSLKFLLVLVLGLALVSCKSVEEEDQRPLVYASFYPIYDFTSKIAGDKVELKQLVPQGQEAHDYIPTTKDIVDLEKSDLLVINGSGMEGWAEDLKTSLRNDLRLVDSGEGLDLIEGHHHHHDEDAHEHGHDHDDHDHEHNHDDHNHDHNHGHNHDRDDHNHDHGGTDPHTWTSPKCAMVQAENIKNALVEIDPKNKDYYEENYEKFKKELEDLDKAYEEAAEGFARKDLVISHEAFSYLARDYGLNQIGLEALIPESEPTPDKMAQVIDLIKDKGIKAIYYEYNGSNKTAQALAKESGAEVLALDTLEAVSYEDLEAGHDYISIMERNLEALKKGLN